MTNIERIINPEESLEEIKETLIGIYKEQYSSKYSDLIKDKINNGIYFFESSPEASLNFMLKFAPNLLDEETFQIEYNDYVIKQQEIARSLTDELFQLYAIAFSLSTDDIKRLMYKKKKLIELPIEAYCNASPKSKYDDLKREYLRRCESLEIKPLINSEVIERLLETRRKYEKNSNIRMITETIWGQRISKEFNKKLGKKISPEYISEVIYGPICNVEIPVNSFTKKKMIYFPVMRQSLYGDLDAAFLHETRHMIEYGKFCTGIDWVSDNYKILNEIRVEKHAIKDDMQTSTIFSKDTLRDGVYSTYRLLFPLAAGLVEEFETQLDEIAINQNIARLEWMFGHKEIKEYGSFLNQEFTIVKNEPFIETYYCSEEAVEKSKEYIKKLKQNAKKHIN